MGVERWRRHPRNHALITPKRRLERLWNHAHDEMEHQPGITTLLPTYEPTYPLLSSSTPWQKTRSIDSPLRAFATRTQR